MGSIETAGAVRRDASTAARSSGANVVAQLPAAVGRGVEAEVANSSRSSQLQRQAVRRSTASQLVRAGHALQVRWDRGRHDQVWARLAQAARQLDQADHRAAPRCSSSERNSVGETTKRSPRCGGCWPSSADRKSTTSSWRRSVAAWPKRQALYRRHTSWWRQSANRRARTHARLATPFGRIIDVHDRARRWARRSSLLSPRPRPRSPLRTARAR